MGNYPVLFVVCLGTVISAYIGSCINIALPNIMAALNFNMDSIVWVSLGYLLPYGSLLPLTGKLGDKYGAKNVYLAGLTLFTVASALCGLSTNATTIVALRVLQGIGGSMLLPNAMIIVVANFTGASRGSALGVWSAMAAAGAALGPTIGGYLIDLFNWRAIFFSVLPFCLAGVAAAYFIIPKSERNLEIRIDFVGSLLLIASISALLIALNQGEREGWLHSYYIVSLFYTAGASFALFLLVERQTASPAVDLQLFKNLNFAVANVVSAISFFTLYGAMFLLPFFMKSILNYNSVQAGVMMLSQTITMVIFAPIGGRLSAKIGSRLPSLFGITMAAYAFYLLKDISANFDALHFCVPLAIYGMGLGFTMSPMTSCAISTLPMDKIGQGSGIFNFAKMVGGAIGIAVAQILLKQREIHHTDTLKNGLHFADDPFSVYQYTANLGATGTFDGTSFSASTATQLWSTSMNLLPETYAKFTYLLSSTLSTQSAIHSFQDCFFILSLLCLLCIVLTLFIQDHPHRPSPTSHKSTRAAHVPSTAENRS